MKKEERILSDNRGQLTIFVIAAIVIVGIIGMIYFFFPSVLVNLGVVSGNPSAFMQDCIEEEIQNNVETISLQGGSLEPENFILYKDQKIEYLCYNGNYYLPCVMQQPLLKQHIESEIERGIKNQEDVCFENLKDSFERRGFDISLSEGETFVELLPKKISVTFEKEITLTQGDESQRFEKINVVLNNNLYELTSIADSILNWEARYGDSETTLYMGYYHDLKVEKLKQSDGSTIYILTDRNKGNKFQFASRSVAWPPGVDI
ncbi:hypothetical protein HYT25_03485 [Candidatus Pacearchaeota archaeon]|nr:hypothetical protein [Candidatus Pacearchaeota archaeon]